MKLLFICTLNQMRSPTGEAVFAGMDGHEALSAGTSPHAVVPVSADLIEWADIIFVMEVTHLSQLNDRFAPQLRAKKLVVLGIPDNFGRMNPDLVALLKSRVSPYLKGTK